MSKTVLLTGGAGFIGSALVRYLINATDAKESSEKSKIVKILDNPNDTEIGVPIKIRTNKSMNKNAIVMTFLLLALCLQALLLNSCFQPPHHVLINGFAHL